MNVQAFAVRSGVADITPADTTAAERTHSIGRMGRCAILQAFLTEALGCTSDCAHDALKNLDRSVSDAILERIDNHLRECSRHEDTVTPAGGRPDRSTVMKLTEAESGRELAIVRVSETEPDMLEYLTGLGLAVKTRLTVRQHRSHSDVTTINVRGQAQAIHLGPVAADVLWVSSAVAI